MYVKNLKNIAFQALEHLLIFMFSYKNNKYLTLFSQ